MSLAFLVFAVIESKTENTVGCCCSILEIIGWKLCHSWEGEKGAARNTDTYTCL